MLTTLQSSKLLIGGLLLILGSGVVHGLQTDRWGKAEAVIEASRRLDEIPTSFGDWTSQAVEIPKNQLKIAEATGTFSRRFVNSSSGTQVSVMILCGKPGPISVHPPTVCFVGAGWGLQNDPKVTKIDNRSEEFWQGHFGKRVDGIQVQLNTLWGWNHSGKWSAYSNPRLETAGNSFLYKMYVTTSGLVETEVDSNEEVSSFLESFLPLVNEALFREKK